MANWTATTLGKYNATDSVIIKLWRLARGQCWQAGCDV